jgi:RNA polymerase sigma-70 factor (ECF subfamily)
LDVKRFKVIYNEYFNQLRSYVYYRSGNEALSSDIAQEAFLKLWEQRDQIIIESVLQFLYTIARNLHTSTYRHEKIKFEFLKKIISDNYQPTTENEFYYKEIKKDYESILAKMPENQREVFLMSRMDGLKYSEIAECLNLSVKAIEKRMKNALFYLKSNLQTE